MIEALLADLIDIIDMGEVFCTVDEHHFTLTGGAHDEALSL